MVPQISKLTNVKNFSTKYTIWRKEKNMTKKLELYRCNICNNLVEVLQEGVGELVCCEQPMELIQANSSEMEELNEKHIPVIEKEFDEVKIRVGAMKHPMTKEHHITFIQAISNDSKYVKTKFLSIEDEPELTVRTKQDSLWARALCNIHGLFKGEK